MDEMTVEKVHQIIEAHLTTIKPDAYVEIAFYGGSFTGIDEEMQTSFLSAADKYVREGRVSGIRLSTRPDYIDMTVLERLKKYNVEIIELGVQSLDDAVLKASCRGHTPEDVYKASALIGDYGFKLGIQTMTGLPEDDKEKDLATARKVIALKPFLVRIYPVLVIRGTPLENLMQQGLYAPQTLEDAVEVCSELLQLYTENNVNVIRIGLQPSENINENAEVAAGPFHPAFRQLVEARLAYKMMEEKIAGFGRDIPPEILVTTGPGNISNITGQNRENIVNLKKKYGFRKIKVKGDVRYTREILIE